MDKRKRLKRELIKTRNIVKRKLKKLKEGVIDREHELQTSYSPVTKSLQQLASNLLNVKLEIKNEPKEENNVEKMEQSMTTQPRFLATDLIAETEPVSDVDEDSEHISFGRESLQEMQERPSFQEYIQQYDPLPRQYIEEMLKDDENKYDHKYGVRHYIESDKFKIGNADLTFKDKDIIINGVKYQGTPGLYELIFKKHPIGYNKFDQQNYIDIVKKN